MMTVVGIDGYGDTFIPRKEISKTIGAVFYANAACRLFVSCCFFLVFLFVCNPFGDYHLVRLSMTVMMKILMPCGARNGHPAIIDAPSKWPGDHEEVHVTTLPNVVINQTSQEQ